LNFLNPFTNPTIVAGYEAWYETTGRRADRLEKALLRRLLAVFARARTLLEVGCGTGHFTRWFGEQGLQVIGLDFSSPMLAEAVRLGSLPYVQGDALALPFRAGAFDLVALITTLEFVNDPVQALAEATRVARHGLILGVLNRHSLLAWQRKRSGEPLWQAARFFTPAELARLVQQAAAGKQVKIVWRTTLWPVWPRELPLPWGGFIGLAVRWVPSLSQVMQGETEMNIKCMMAVWLCSMSLVVVACAGRVGTSPTTDGGVLVAASIAPLADFARQVGGDHVQVITLVPPGASPHTYELTPSQVEQVAKARLLAFNGVGLEFWADKLIQSADNPNLIVVDTSQGIEILEGDADEPGGNPHIWLDPQNAIVQVEHIRDALTRADPAHADDYRANAEGYIAELQALDQEIANEVTTWSNRQFIAFHPAWVYFARRYGLVQAAVIECSPGREPSPAEVAQIVETAKRIGAKAIFAELQFSPKAAQAIAEESGAQVLFLDPLGSSLEDPTYLNLMRYNVAQMAKALQ